jgi:hypothetical protein
MRVAGGGALVVDVEDGGLDAGLGHQGNRSAEGGQVPVADVDRDVVPEADTRAGGDRQQGDRVEEAGVHVKAGDERRRADDVNDVDGSGEERDGLEGGVGEAGRALGDREAGEGEGRGGVAGAGPVGAVVEVDGVVARAAGDRGGAGGPPLAVELHAAGVDDVVAAAGGDGQVHPGGLGIEVDGIGAVAGVEQELFDLVVVDGRLAVAAAVGVGQPGGGGRVFAGPENVGASDEGCGVVAVVEADGVEAGAAVDGEEAGPQRVEVAGVGVGVEVGDAVIAVAEVERDRDAAGAGLLDGAEVDTVGAGLGGDDHEGVGGRAVDAVDDDVHVTGAAEDPEDVVAVGAREDGEHLPGLQRSDRIGAGAGWARRAAAQGGADPARGRGQEQGVTHQPLRRKWRVEAPEVSAAAREQRV